MTRSRVDYLANSEHRKAVLRTGLIEVSEIHTASPSSVQLRNQYGVRDSSGVLRFANEPRSDELIDFVFKRLGALGVERSPFLSSGRDPRIDIQTVAH